MGKINDISKGPWEKLKIINQKTNNVKKTDNLNYCYYLLMMVNDFWKYSFIKISFMSRQKSF